MYVTSAYDVCLCVCVFVQCMQISVDWMICWDTRKLPPRLCKRNNNNSKPAPRLLTVANLAASGWHHEYILFEKKKNYKIKAFWLWYSSCEAEGVEDVYRISLKKKGKKRRTHTHTQKLPSSYIIHSMQFVWLGAWHRAVRSQDPLGLHYELIWIWAYCRELHTRAKRVLHSMCSLSCSIKRGQKKRKEKMKRIFFFSFSSGRGWRELLDGLHSVRSLIVGGVWFLRQYVCHDSFVILYNRIRFLFYCWIFAFTWVSFLNLCVWLCVCYSSLPGWMRSSSSSAWKAKPVSMPSTTITTKWRSTATPPRSRSSSSALKVRLFIYLFI